MSEPQKIRYVLYWRMPKDISEKVRELSSIINSTPTKLEPHCSIFHYYSTSDQEHKMVDVFSNLNMLKSKNVRIQFSEPAYFSPDVAVLKLQNNYNIISAHHQALSGIKLFNIYPQEEFFQNINENNIESYLQFGHPYFGKLYAPHVSIGKLSEESYNKNISIIKDYMRNNKLFSRNTFYPKETVLIRKNDMKILAEF